MVEETKVQLREIQEKIHELKKQERQIEKRYIEQLKEKCRENIGRCFTKTKDDKVVAYCKITDIYQEFMTKDGVSHFNEYQYPSLWFNYPYNNSVDPFYKEDLFSGAWGKGIDTIAEINKVAYVEISKKEFMDKFNEVQMAWTKRLEV